MAPGHHWRGPGWRRIASSVRRKTRQELGAYEHRWSPITIRGGGHPKQAMVLTPVSRMGPPPRSFAADAHGCIMVRSLWTYRIQGCGASSSCPDSEFASHASPRPQRAWPPCSGLSRRGLETMEREASAERRQALTAPARAGFPHSWVGAKKRDSKANKNWDEGSGECRELVLDFESLIQGLLGLYSRYGPPDRSAARGDLCHEAPTCSVTRASRSSASGSIDNSPGGTLLHK